MNVKGWVKKILDETKLWAGEGIISEEQRQRINARYSDKLQYNRLINTVVTLGSILIGLGILLFVASNWDKLSRPFKITLIFSVISIFHFLGYYFRYVKEKPQGFSADLAIGGVNITSYAFKDEFPGLGEGFLLIGAFAFGAGIWLIAQIYQIHYNFSAGILFWILGILPVAYLYRSWTILALSSLLSLIWLESYMIYYPLRQAYGFFLLLAVIIGLSYLYKQRFSLFMMAAAVVIWLTHFWVREYFTSRFFDNMLMPHLLLAGIYIVFGFILYGFGIWHQRNEKFAVFSFLYKFLGIILITLPCYSLTFSHHYVKGTVFIVPQAVIILWAVLSLFAVGFIYRLYKTSDSGRDLKEVKILLSFFLVQVLIIAISLKWPAAVSLSFNLILLAEILGFIYLGFIRHSEGLFRLAIVLFFLHILSRYFDIFWKMMPRSLLFIFGGIILISGAIWANKKRIELEEKMAGSGK
ncbi:MAG: DUF2157 domain-containing protein [Candidatus Omnitrophota bacterium]